MISAARMHRPPQPQRWLPRPSQKLHRLHRDLGAFPPDDLQVFVFKLVSHDEKLLKLLLNRL